MQWNSRGCVCCRDISGCLHYGEDRDCLGYGKDRVFFVHVCSFNVYYYVCACGCALLPPSLPLSLLLGEE